MFLLRGDNKAEKVKVPEDRERQSLAFISSSLFFLTYTMKTNLSNVGTNQFKPYVLYLKYVLRHVCSVVQQTQQLKNVMFCSLNVCLQQLLS